MGALIAVDIGGTSMRAAAYLLRECLPAKFNKIQTPKEPELVFDKLIDLIDSVWINNEEIRAISIASPGPIDKKNGFVYAAPNIAGWSNYPLGEKLRKLFSIPVFLGNDANFATLGEWRYGAGIGHSNLIYLTISTGIGGGVICDNQLILGRNGLATEMGHVIVQPEGPLCSCGKRGHLEGIASGPAIVSYVKEKILAGQQTILSEYSDFSTIEVANAAKKGDSLANSAISRAGKFLGLALTSFVHLFNPSIIVLGGGVSLIGELLFDPIKNILHEEVMDQSYLENLKIVPAKLGDDSGLLGALVFGQTQLGIT